LPMNELFDDLANLSENGGVTDISAFVSAFAQPVVADVRGQPNRFALFRIGDANATRGIHAAVFDAARLCSNL